MKDQPVQSAPTNRVRGFTLIELLVVVSIIALLIAILLPSLRQARLRAKEVTCGVNIRMMIVTTQTYANSFQGKFPDLARKPQTNSVQAYPYWTWPYWTNYFRDEYGVERDLWFSPTNKIWNDDALWFWGWNGADPDTATSKVFGLFYFGSDSLVNKKAFKAGVVDPSVTVRSALFPTQQSDTKTTFNVLWTDLNRKYAGQFIGAGNRWGSNHMYDADADLPSGSHVGYVDGSVIWHTRDEVQHRISYPVPSSADLYW
ncbi:MAG: prepilin-type N-terminal cleavage/methylation domain-containing protein [Phycisphaera sp.]|nr:prepilin-type N-terminal cleavage/methylation domain-containing protein [Phycisphaera sp.]